MNHVRISSADTAQELQLQNFSRLYTLDLDFESDQVPPDPLSIAPYPHRVTNLSIWNVPPMKLDPNSLARYSNLRVLGIYVDRDTSGEYLNIPHLPNLDDLGIGVNKLGSISCSNTKLTTLGIYDNEINSVALDHFTQLRTLAVSSKQLAGRLDSLTNLRSLTLGGLLCDFEASHLTALTRLEHVALHSTEAANRALPLLPSGMLTTLLVGHSGKVDMQHVCKLSHLQRLELSGEVVSVERLSDLSRLTSLSLSRASSDAFATLASLTHLRYLSLRTHPMAHQDPNVVLRIDRLVQLEWLLLSHTINIDARNIDRLSQLRVLSIRKPAWDTELLERVSQITSLEHLMVGSAQVSDDSISLMQNLSRLTYLNLAITDTSTMTGVTLTLLTSLVSFVISPPRRLAVDITTLKSKMPKLYSGGL